MIRHDTENKASKNGERQGEREEKNYFIVQMVRVHQFNGR